MKPFKQGNLDRFCSVYSVLNSMQLLGINLPYYKAQKMYDYIIDQLNICDSFFDTAEYGADYKRLEQIMSYAKEYVKTVFKAELSYHHPFYNQKLFFDEILNYMQTQRNAGKSVIIRVRSKEIDHYSVFYGLIFVNFSFSSFLLNSDIRILLIFFIHIVEGKIKFQ